MITFEKIAVSSITINSIENRMDKFGQAVTEDAAKRYFLLLSM